MGDAAGPGVSVFVMPAGVSLSSWLELNSSTADAASSSIFCVASSNTSSPTEPHELSCDSLLSGDSDDGDSLEGDGGDCDGDASGSVIRMGCVDGVLACDDAVVPPDGRGGGGHSICVVCGIPFSSVAAVTTTVLPGDVVEPNG